MRLTVSLLQSDPGSLCKGVGGSLTVANRQRVRRVRLGLLRRMSLSLLRDHLRAEEFELTFCLVAAPEMTRLNESFLRHRGSTDVITFDYGERARKPHRSRKLRRATLSREESGLSPALLLHGDIFICVSEALIQARRFGTSWQSELVRYVIHGVLHLCGYDDKNVSKRRKMKRIENRLLRELAAQFRFEDLG